ncbi:MAG: hypothetical protein Q7T74_04180 [Candidatus Saccharibacteria bacterium]|nr:hypothetical protein [Candidatus Saccharibacteria bacterium]
MPQQNKAINHNAENIIIDKRVLKSGLQKAIRQCEPEQAMRITKSFLEVDAKDCLRRLPVITLEDVMLHPDMDRLIDLYRQSGRKSFVLSDEDKNFVLRYVWQLASTEWRDNFWKNNPDGSESPDLERLTEKQQALSNAVDYRASAGGLPEDPPMMRWQLRAWQNRWTHCGMDVSDLFQFFPDAPTIDWNDIGYAKTKDIPLNAYDFHVLGSTFNRLIAQKRYVKDAVSATYPDKSVQFVVMNLVWRYWVAVNKKKQITHGRVIDWFVDDGEKNAFPESERESMDMLWKIIKDDVQSLSEWVRDKKVVRDGTR